jgi:hypothetical protein
LAGGVIALYTLIWKDSIISLYSTDLGTLGTGLPFLLSLLKTLALIFICINYNSYTDKTNINKNKIVVLAFRITLTAWQYRWHCIKGWAQLLFEIVSECYERKSLVITTNIEFSRWVNVLYDEQMTGALLDRLLHHCYLLIFEGESERMKNSLVRQG